MRPVNRGSTPLNSNGVPKNYTTYGKARRDLIGRLGEYCSYCEMELDSSLAIEHIQPKAHHPTLELRWDNFLLACTNCNSIKGDSNFSLECHFWAHSDNTFRVFEYGEGGVIKVVSVLSGSAKAKASMSLFLTGLNRTPDSVEDTDRRWKNRREAWEIAQESKRDLADCDCEPMRRQIIRSAVAKGYWSVWMTVFADDSDILHRLIEVFPGTATNCFNDQGQPLSRPGGQI